MESDETLIKFKQRRDRFYWRLGEIRANVDAILLRLESTGATMQEAAMLEAWHAERQQLFEEFQRATDEFTAYVMKVAQQERR